MAIQTVMNDTSKYMEKVYWRWAMRAIVEAHTSKRRMETSRRSRAGPCPEENVGKKNMSHGNAQNHLH